MTEALLLAVAGLAVVCLCLLVGLLRVRANARGAVDDLERLRSRLDALEGPQGLPATGTSGPVEFVITDLGRDHSVSEPVGPVRLERSVFADIVLRESVVKAASLAHGVRRGLAPATRNRIRFEMRQEVRRARKQRRADQKASQRDRHARQRATSSADRREAS
ncbi:MAG TPA: hypothetical protein VFI21_07675 [Nocardioides sp.]|nr:hypothetical protein [Nocardioides sp.]